MSLEDWRDDYDPIDEDAEPTVDSSLTLELRRKVQYIDRVAQTMERSYEGVCARIFFRLEKAEKGCTRRAAHSRGAR